METSPVAHRALKKRAEIQGLRAIAVLSVVFFHGFGDKLPGGFIGVDIFFVISGFLITGILLEPLEARSFSLVHFYQKRISRLLPAFFVVMVATLIGGLLFLPPGILISLIESQFFATLFVSNFYFLDNTGYFDLDAELLPFLHSWSLAIEEQFYLVYPLILLVLYKWARRYLWLVLLGLGLMSLMASQYWSVTDPKVAFFHPFSRAFELLIGALAYGVKKNFSQMPLALPRLSNALGLFGLLVLALSFFLIDESTLFPGLVALVPCFASFVLLLGWSSFANRALSIKPLTIVGDWSYSLYLWHWPLLVFAKLLFPYALGAKWIAILLAFIASALSTRFVEAPFLERDNKRAGAVKGFSMAGLTIAALISVLIVIYNADGLPGRFSPRERVFIAAAQDFNHDRPQCHMRSDRPKEYDDLCVYGAKNIRASYAVWGDSHGAELAKILGEKLQAQHLAVRSITMSGCPAAQTIRAACTNQVRASLGALMADKDMKTIILTANLHGDSAAMQEIIAGVLHSALALRKSGKRVVLIAPIPTFAFDPPSRLALTARWGHDPQSVAGDRAEYDRQRAPIAARFQQFGTEHDIDVIYPADFLCDDQKCFVYRASKGVLYYNKNHLSMKGAGLLAERIIAQTNSDPD